MADYSTGKFNSMPPQPRLGFVEPQSGEGVTVAPGDATLTADNTVPPDNMTDVGNSALRTSPSARAVHARVSQLYRQHWAGHFLDAQLERAYQERRWLNGRIPRRCAILILWVAVIRYTIDVVAFFTFSGANSEPHVAAAWPGVFLGVLGGVMVTAAWSPSRLVMKHWTFLSVVGSLCGLAPLLYAPAIVLCDRASAKAVEGMLDCSALQHGNVPATAAIVVVVNMVVLPGAHHVSWWAATITSLAMLALLVISYARHVPAPALGQTALVLALSTLVVAFAARSRELAERALVASLHTTARFSELRQAAQLAALRAKSQREAADARTNAFQNVMRYVCHELRNPLHGIMGLLENVRSGLAGYPEVWVAEDLDSMMGAASSMATILNDVLDLGQLQQGKLALEPAATALTETLLRSASAIQGISPVPIFVHTGASMPDMVVIDRLRYGQILTNAISNAAKATSAGRIDVAGRVEDGCLVTEVFDTGRGLPAEVPDLFQPYAQVTATATARATPSRFQRGTGLGLAIAGQLVDLMHGTISLVNRTDGTRGARFTFRIPCVEPALDQVNHCDGNVTGEARPSSASAGIYEQPAPFGGASAPDTSIHCELVTKPSTQLPPQAIPSTRSLGCRDAGPEHASVAGCPPTILNEHTERYQVYLTRPLLPRHGPIAGPGERSGGSSRSMGSTLSSAVRFGVSNRTLAHTVSGHDGSKSPTPVVVTSSGHHATVTAQRSGPLDEPRSNKATTTPTAVSVGLAQRGLVASAGRETGHDVCAAGSADAASDGGGSALGDAALQTRVGSATASTGVVESSQLPDARKQRRTRRSARRAAATSTARAEFTGARVLVIDDEKINRSILKRHCQKAGCEVRTMEDGDELLQLIEDEGLTPDGTRVLDGGAPVDVIFLDILMQRTNGETVCVEMRKRGITTPIVAATGNAVREDIERYTSVGFSKVMLKPFSGATVASVLRTLVRSEAAT